MKSKLLVVLIVSSACASSEDDLNSGAFASNCGDGRIDIGEQCDLGAENSDALDASCTTSCRVGGSVTALTSCEEDSECVALTITGRVVGLPVPVIQARTGVFVGEARADATGAYTVGVEIRDRSAPLLLVAISDAPLYDATRFISGVGSAERVLELAEANQLSAAEHPFVNLSAAGTAFNLAVSVNSETPDWNGTTRSVAEWRLGRDIAVGDIRDLTLALSDGVNNPDTVDYGVATTEELIGNAEALGALLVATRAREDLAELEARFFATGLDTGLSFTAAQVTGDFWIEELQAGPIVSSRANLSLVSDGTGTLNESRLAGAVVTGPVEWSLENGELRYSQPGVSTPIVVNRQQVLDAYAGDNAALTVIEGAMTQETDTLFVEETQLTSVESLLAEGAGSRLVATQNFRSSSLAPALLEQYGITVRDETAITSAPIGLGVRLFDNQRPILPFPALEGETYALHIYRTAQDRFDNFDRDGTDLFFSHRITFRPDGTATAVGPDWVDPLEVTWSLDPTTNALTITTFEATTVCQLFVSTEVMDAAVCDVTYGDNQRWRYASRGALVDSSFAFDRSQLESDLTRYLQSTVTWINDRITGPDEVGESARFGFLFADDGSFRQVRLRNLSGDPGSLDPVLPTLFIDGDLQSTVTPERSDIIRAEDLIAGERCEDRLEDAACLITNRRIWYPIALRGDYLVVQEEISRPDFAEIIGWDGTQYTNLEGEPSNLQRRIHNAMPRINAYYFDAVPAWPWVSSSSACGSPTIVDGRFDRNETCQPRGFDLPSVTEEVSAQFGLALDVEGDGTDELFVVGRSGDPEQTDISLWSVSNGVFLQTSSSVLSTASVLDLVVTDSTNTGSPEVTLALTDGTLAVCTTDLVCTQITPPAAPISLATFTRGGAPALAVASQSNDIVLYSASPSGFVSSDGITLPETAEGPLATGDLTGNGFDDIVFSGNELHVYEGSQSGAFTSFVTADESQFLSMRVAPVRDSDRNQLIGTILLPEPDEEEDEDPVRTRLFYFPKLTSLGFTIGLEQTSTSLSGSFDLADLDGDTNLEAIAFGSELEVFYGTGDGIDSAVPHPRSAPASGLDAAARGAIGNFDAQPGLDAAVVDPTMNVIELFSGIGAGQ